MIHAVKNTFKLRKKEAEIIKKYSSCCIDTSDGVLNAINTISEMSGTGYELKSLPYIKNGVVAANLLSLPKRLLFLGEAGEYELLFTVKRELEEEFESEAKQQGLHFYKIGHVTEANVKILHEAGNTFDLKSFDIRARDFNHVKDYLNRLIEFVKG